MKTVVFNLNDVNDLCFFCYSNGYQSEIVSD